MRRVLVALVILVMAAACGSMDLGSLGGILGSPSADQPSDVTGVVSAVDQNNQRIDLSVLQVNNLRQTNTTGSIYYTSQTTVRHQGNTYRVEDLERGDEISVRGSNNNGRYVAEVITVTRDAS